ncbi:MAG TPA: FkbM family methyltransferase [Chitinophaga sp.]|uniref:FkbM family methyltransferase n=1 Tax=Chitinophaga sp. TaxID=1869181 RepID=UPI002C0FAE5C|nr:FkbM family methyltransferase [Chitinophaga sp.]HVI44175.1 FkbM family methyltransferase [Chitinophaga sp.]
MHIFFKITDAARVMLKTGMGLSMLWKKGASVASSQILYNCKKFIPELQTVLDVGANQGQFALAATHFYPNASIHAFEPVPETYAVLQRNTRRSSNIHTYNFALGSNTGTLEFYSNAYSHASSALEVSELQRKTLPFTANVQQIEVPVKRLDEWLQGIRVNAPLLLKLDVQGFEKEVLKGAANCMDRVDYLLFETSFVAMYNGEPLFDEMHNYVKSLDFEFIAPVSFLQSDELQILQMDLLYRRKK